MVFVQETQHGQLNKMQWVIVTQDFTKLHTINCVKRYGFNIGSLDGFLDLNICGINMDRVMEFLETMNEYDTTKVTNHQGEKKKIVLTPQLVSEALKLPNHGYVLGTWLSRQDKVGAFKKTLGKILTYADLKHADTKLLLRLHHQHFEMGRAPRYTQLA